LLSILLVPPPNDVDVRDLRFEVASIVKPPCLLIRNNIKLTTSLSSSTNGAVGRYESRAQVTKGGAGTPLLTWQPTDADGLGKNVECVAMDCGGTALLRRSPHSPSIVLVSRPFSLRST
jgi:hypothetical protein